MWAALNHPVLFIIALIAFIALMIWLLPKIWRGKKRLHAKSPAGLVEKNPQHHPNNGRMFEIYFQTSK
jgi:hypothetical protein